MLRCNCYQYTLVRIHFQYNYIFQIVYDILFQHIQFIYYQGYINAFKHIQKNFQAIFNGSFYHLKLFQKDQISKRYHPSLTQSFFQVFQKEQFYYKSYFSGFF
ncbi:transmembrane protein, putative (macronuclear) [Tetrahymena thermophila SB210]|uniref:Transmembrane protein, putative n=1 Tax=Tetrahymena thermophila (strain SB210) TaxID=312017 RepID=W7X6L9_TETTS|nr:transmembrane protein, putative [Tetrahymena thermophila SB210]EWS73032.1 transmembrane protein, putative [Tetrahymena thermophila SB210]|eukprot:XP_012654429.1 transmembrane protein, putative [Tetrahymena thermophila SB210]